MLGVVGRGCGICVMMGGWLGAGWLVGRLGKIVWLVSHCLREVCILLVLLIRVYIVLLLGGSRWVGNRGRRECRRRSRSGGGR